MCNRNSLYLLTIFAAALPAFGQSIVGKPGPLAPTPVAASASTAIPFLVPYSGQVPGQASGLNDKRQTSATFLIFKDETGGEPLWAETQTVSCDEAGRYQVYLGAASAAGLPPDLFLSGEARWLEVQIAGQPQQPRTLLASVPYAVKAADAATLGGLPASAFLLAGAKTAGPSAAIAPDATSNTVTTLGGAAGYLPVFSGAATIGNSILFESAKSIGVNTIAPAANLDVNGSAIVRGDFLLESKGVATAALGQGSQPLEFIANAYNKTSAKATANYFALQAEPYANNTATPGATLNLIYGNGTGAAETGLSIASNGILKFAPGQTFPASSTTGVGITGTSSSGNGVEGTSAAGNGVEGITNGTALGTGGVMGIAGVGNTSGFNGIAGVWGNASKHVGVLGTSDQFSGVQGLSQASYGVQGVSINGSGVFGSNSGNVLNTAGVLGWAGAPSGVSHVLVGVWGDSYGEAGVEGTSNQSVGVYGQSNVDVGVQGVSTSGPGLSGTSTTNVGASGASSSGTGVSGTSVSGNGAFGYTLGITSGTAGTLGVAGSRTGLGGIAGVWGDAAAHVGVFGSSNQYSGVQGSSVYAPGVQGNSTSGNGVHGVSSGTSGIFGETSSSSAGDAALYGLSHNGALGVFGFSPKFGIEGESGGNSQTGALSNTFINGPAAVWGDTNGAGYAVAGTTDNGIAGYFMNNSTSNAAIQGQNNSSWPGGTSPYPISVLGYATGTGNGTRGLGVEGFAYNGAGVYGIGGGSSGTKVLQVITDTFGVVGDTTGTPHATGILGAANDSYAGYFENNSILASVYGFNYGSGSGVQSNFRTVEGATPDGVCGFGDMGNLTCSGQLKSLASTDDARTVETYSMQSPENWIEDFGSGTVEHGVGKVTIDPLFARTVSASNDYHVFLTPNGDSKGLYVVAKTATGFEVRESGGGRSTLAFDYRIVAKRRGYETQRMTDVTEQFNAEKARIAQHVKESAAIYDQPTHPIPPPASTASVRALKTNK